MWPQQTPSIELSRCSEQEAVKGLMGPVTVALPDELGGKVGEAGGNGTIFVTGVEEGRVCVAPSGPVLDACKTMFGSAPKAATGDCFGPLPQVKTSPTWLLSSSSWASFASCSARAAFPWPRRFRSRRVFSRTQAFWLYRALLLLHFAVV